MRRRGLFLLVALFVNFVPPVLRFLVYAAAVGFLIVALAGLH